MFIGEGIKIVSELIYSNYPVEKILFIKGKKHTLPENILNHEGLCEVDEKTIKKISCLKSPQPILGIFKIPNSGINIKDTEKKLTIVLDNIQDPGNLGTVIRIADWFGIETIICSEDCVDAYNPKVVQATMGSISRVKILYTDIALLLKNANTNIYGTHLEGENLYNMKLENKGYLIFGNEGKGLSIKVESLINKKIFIPPYPNKNKEIDSLNISVATGIICAEFRRQRLFEIK